MTETVNFQEYSKLLNKRLEQLKPYIEQIVAQERMQQQLVPAAEKVAEAVKGISDASQETKIVDNEFVTKGGGDEIKIVNKEFD